MVIFVLLSFWSNFSQKCQIFPNQWILLNNESCIYEHNITMTFERAYGYCKSLNSSLIYFQTKTKMDSFKNLTGNSSSIIWVFDIEFFKRIF